MRNKRAFQLTDYTPDYREARGENKRPLLNPDEVLRLPHDEMLIIMRGQKVLKAKKFDYTRHPESELLTYTSIFDYNPRSFDPSRYSVKETHLNGVPIRDESAKTGGVPNKATPNAANQQHVLAADGSQMGNQWNAKPKQMQGKPNIP
jgi:type IV secretory pathway TraG/TraD family ATPase VirD4